MDPSMYEYSSPLEGWQNQELPLSEPAEDGKPLENPPPTKKSEAYYHFVEPISNGKRGGFDIHVYFLQTKECETVFAKALHERIRREFPELRIYQVVEKPIGPHPVGMFEVNLFTPEQFGAFIPWLVINQRSYTKGDVDGSAISTSDLDAFREFRESISDMSSFPLGDDEDAYYSVENPKIVPIPAPSVSIHAKSLLVNGGFKSGLIAPWVISNNPQIISPGLSGSGYALFPPDNAYLIMHQDVETLPNTLYELSYEILVGKSPINETYYGPADHTFS